MGGTRIDVGVDLNGNGSLDTQEITSTSYVCTGATGANALVRATPLPVGDLNCPAGGQRLDVGIDRDGDGTLSSGEVQSTSFLCSGLKGLDGKGGGCHLSGGGASAAGIWMIVMVAVFRRHRRSNRRQ
jgi:hypothetical protein